MNATIVEAIRTKHRLAFAYDGKARVVEPQCYGVGTKGTQLLRGLQVAGGSHPEALFDVAKIVGLRMLDDRFERPGPHDVRDDSAMTIIHAQL